MNAQARYAKCLPNHRNEKKKTFDMLAKNSQHQKGVMT